VTVRMEEGRGDDAPRDARAASASACPSALEPGEAEDRDEEHVDAEHAAERTDADAVDAERWMRRALELAERGRRTVSPNPLVGCVLVRDGVVVGEGWHERAGGPHAEVVALAAAGPAAAGATAFVTLEPCAHIGRTGPCATALVAAGVARVVVALADPNPVAAGGAEVLRAAGVPVEVGVADEEARRQNAVFLHGVATGRPFVVAKAAVSLDGRIAAADGTSRWLTGAAARERAHALRAEVDAVVVGSGTVLADDPALTVRLPGFDGPQPLRVVLDGRGRTPSDARVLDGMAPTLLLSRDPGRLAAAAAVGAHVERVPAGRDGGGVDLGAALAALWEREVRSVLVEGGAAVLHALLAADLVDRLHVHVAPVLLGDAARPLLAGPWAATLADAPRFALEEVERVGDDALLTLLPPPRKD
jgi:diaminohydroxyphosphoribosylaminopyrimidine deaminase / 5-amino-6-(5-phosphoribosylamino)uracil reductase